MGWEEEEVAGDNECMMGHVVRWRHWIEGKNQIMFSLDKEDVVGQVSYQSRASWYPAITARSCKVSHL